MKSKLLYGLVILLFISCKTRDAAPVKVKKIAVHTFTGKGEHDETTNWFYIRNIVERGFSGYYLQSTSKVSDFKQVNFIYSKIQPPEFHQQAASDEKLQFLDTDDLPDELLKDSSNLESLYQ